MSATQIPGTDRPITAEYVQAYAIAFYWGYEHGDQDAAREAVEKRWGPSTRDNLDAYAGLDHGYTDGVEHYMEERRP